VNPTGQVAKGATPVVDEREVQASILIVDDEVGMREGCRRVLTPAGYSVDTAAKMSTALDLVRSNDYDLYLLDVMLPDGSGLDLLAAIIRHDPNAICIIITGFGSIELAVEAVRHGAIDFLSKPFTSDELLVSVSQGLEWGRLKEIEAEAAELVRAKAELQRLGEARRQLMFGLAHELRAPVAAVQSYINLILAGYVTTDELRPTLFRVQERLDEMLDLIADLLELARLKVGKERPVGEAQLQDMAAILRKVCDLFRPQAHEKGQNLQVDILDNPFVIADRSDLEQIWTNLISNAIKYTPEGGRIEVMLQSEQDSIIGTVADSGIGIADDDRQRLFEDFFRTDEAKESGEIGTGLGLSIVKQTLESYGGEISVTSRLGHGSRFTFILPKKPDPQEPEAMPSEPEPAPISGPPRIVTQIPSVVLGEE
jgi:two-component system sensor histidine kinase/response regulator